LLAETPPLLGQDGESPAEIAQTMKSTFSIFAPTVIHAVSPPAPIQGQSGEPLQLSSRMQRVAVC
jgi:hypothetical protein